MGPPVWSDTWKITPVNASCIYAHATTSRAELPGSGGLAKGASVGAGGLWIHGIVSRSREVWFVPSDAPCCGFQTRPHRGGLWQTQSGRESSLLEHRGGFAGGVPLLLDPRR